MKGRVLLGVGSRRHLPCVLGSSLGFCHRRYTRGMSTFVKMPNSPAPQQRWRLFEQLCGDRVRASDASWACGLSPAERLAVTDDLFVTVRAAHVAAGDWHQVEDRNWQESLRDRLRQVQAFQRFDEASRGTSPLADAG